MYRTAIKPEVSGYLVSIYINWGAYCLPNVHTHFPIVSIARKVEKQLLIPKLLEQSRNLIVPFGLILFHFITNSAYNHLYPISFKYMVDNQLRISGW